MGVTRQAVGTILALAVLAAGGCANRSKLATDPPSGLKPIDLGRDGLDSGEANHAVTLEPPSAVNESRVADFGSPTQQGLQPRAIPTPQPEITGPSQLRVGIDGARPVSPGDPVSLEVSVANTGGAPATNVKLRAEFDAGLRHETGVQILDVAVGTLAAGQSTSIPLSLTAAVPGKPVVQVVGTADGNLRSEAAKTVPVARRALQFGLTGSPTIYVNRPGTWDVRVANAGDAGLTNVTARLRLPRELRFQSATGGGQLVAGEVVWAIGELRPGERRELQVTATPVTVTERASVIGVASAERVTVQSAETQFEALGMPVLRAEVVPPAQPIRAGGKGIVTLRITNQGTLAARDVSVAAVTAAKYLTPQFAGGPTVGRVHGERVEFAPVPRIDVGQTVTLQIDVAGVEAGDGRVRVEVRSESAPTPLTVEEPIRVR
jgi:uncharacterized repeat protein (TIGR01451 family)